MPLAPPPPCNCAQKLIHLLFASFHYLDNLLAFLPLRFPEFVFQSGRSGGGGEVRGEALPSGCWTPVASWGVFVVCALCLYFEGDLIPAGAKEAQGLQGCWARV